MLTLHWQITVHQLFRAETGSPRLTCAYVRFVPFSGSSFPTSKYLGGACENTSDKSLFPFPTEAAARNRLWTQVLPFFLTTSLAGLTKDASFPCETCRSLYQLFSFQQVLFLVSTDIIQKNLTENMYISSLNTPFSPLEKVSGLAH